MKMLLGVAQSTKREQMYQTPWKVETQETIQDSKDAKRLIIYLIRPATFQLKRVSLE